jgi:hypothetical protein
MVHGLAVIDYANYAKNPLDAPDATKRCPTGAIVWVENAQQFTPLEARDGASANDAPQMQK